MDGGWGWGQGARDKRAWETEVGGRRSIGDGVMTAGVGRTSVTGV